MSRIKLEDMPLEELVRGTFPEPAWEQDLNDPNRYSGDEWVSEEDVAQRVLYIRKHHLVHRFQVYVEPHIGDSTVTIDSVAGPDLKWSGNFPKKSFKLMLPKWLSFERFYDHLDIEASLVRAFVLRLYEFSNVPPVLKVRVEGDDAPRFCPLKVIL